MSATATKLPPNAWFERLRHFGVPEHLHDGLVNYLAHHKRPGSFLTHVLENNLRDAVGRADEKSAAGLANIVRFLYNDAPMLAWGSPELVQAWLDAGTQEETVSA